MMMMSMTEYWGSGILASSWRSQIIGQKKKDGHYPVNCTSYPTDDHRRPEQTIPMRDRLPDAQVLLTRLSLNQAIWLLCHCAELLAAGSTSSPSQCTRTRGTATLQSCPQSGRAQPAPKGLVIVARSPYCSSPMSVRPLHDPWSRFLTRSGRRFCTGRRCEAVRKRVRGH